MEIRTTEIINNGVKKILNQEKQVSVERYKTCFYINTWGWLSIRVFMSKNKTQSDTQIVFTKEETDALMSFLVNNKR